jgi:spermidine synthase
LSVAVTVLAFFASGVAALLYQVLWQRLLSIFSGADVYSATVIVAAFMAGLGAGSLAGGRLADHASRRGCLLIFAAAEAGVGFVGALSGWFYYDVLYQSVGSSDLGRGATGLVLFASLLPPTFCMGASLPLLARAVTDTVEGAAVRVSTLYGVNTMGAAFGALLGTWVLLPSRGLEGSLRVAALINLSCAFIVLPLAIRLPSARPRASASAQAADGAAVAAIAPWPWLLAYAGAGFVALSYEILWFRVLGVAVKSSAFTFGTLLAIYLAGLGWGAAIGTRVVQRCRHPGRTFLALQASAGIVACLSLVGFVAGADQVRFLAGYLAQYEPLDVRRSVQDLLSWRTPANFLRLYVGLPVVLVLPATLLMGVSFPYMQRALLHDERRVGRTVAAALGANIAGSILGTVVTGTVLLGFLGSTGTLRVLAGLTAGFAWLALRHRGPSAALTGTGLALAAAAVVPDGGRWWASLHGTTEDRIVVSEDQTGLSVIVQGSTRGSGAVFVNGMGQSTIPYGDLHTALGVLPVLLHPRPHEVAIVGLGSGDTCYAAAARADTRRVTCIEIIGPQLTTLRAWSMRDAYGGLIGLLSDPRVTHVVGDGRAYLRRSAGRFDVIEADALRPTSAYSGHLYSEGYFTVVRERLNPGGLATTWAPTRRIHDGFVKVFPHAVSLPGLLVGSRDPIVADFDLLVARASDSHVQRHFARAGVDVTALVAKYFREPVVRFGPETDRTRLTDVNTDLFPKDEFDLTTPR